jgi:hypothetical protein
MRLTTLILAGLVCSGSAAAQNWQEYSYPDQFFAVAHKGRLYQIEGKSVSAENDAGAIRFVQSLVFTGGGSNRSPDEIRAAWAACRGAGTPEIAGVPGAEAQDTGRCNERRRRQRGGGWEA